MFLIKAIYLMARSGHRRRRSPLRSSVNFSKGSILVIYVSARCCPVLAVNSRVDLVVDDDYSTVWLGPS